ncbi:MAG TPA: transcriptional repressor [Firmicutes bacterium]|jgi:Fur family transcriptional regulator, ferric uptake regulator|nr:transcriptional repressor [Bacillota bacterium]
MNISKEEDILTEYLKKKDLKLTGQRKIILDAFLGVECHVTAEELYEIIKHNNPEIGVATVYRTLKILCEAGLANEVKFSDKVTHYEHLFDHQHHDHLICVKCGQYTEVCDPEIEELQQKLAERNKFKVLRHRMELYGICKNCIGK